MLQIVGSYRQQQNQNEAGGILLGRMWPDKIVVEQVSVPGLGDRSGRHFFERDSKRAQKAIDEAWEKSGGEVRYLGEWHTHPERHPTPSCQDKKMISGVFHRSPYRYGPILLLIVGTATLWLGVQTERRLHSLNLRSTW